MATFPTDQFDNLPDDLERVGAHRGPKVRGRGWIGFAWALLATGVLVVAGLFVLSQLDNQFTFRFPGATASTPTPKPTVSHTPSIQPITDPLSIKSRKITVTVLNGTAVVGLQNQAGTRLAKAHWTVGSRALASVNTVKETVVYYSLAANQDVAEGVALALGTTAVRQSDVYQGAPITVVLGADFKG
jgi:LytR cell envelope-related transcriptional attenuator